MIRQDDIIVVISVNKSDLWFCRICVSSIRYYYPNVDIFLIKDNLNGEFSTREIEFEWNVRLIEFEKNKFGWGVPKMFLFTDSRFYGKYLFVLDSDIVVLGKLLDYLWNNLH